jgi:glycosyltransferase involved in cell wall biosynthesis
VLFPALRWPPETFVGTTLRGLAKDGLRVTVASRARPGLTLDAADGIELRRLPLGDEALPRQLSRAAVDAVRLARADRRALREVTWQTIRPAVPRRVGGARSALKRLRTLLPLAGLRPDVVHFQWESAAVSHLALYDVWACPVVVSCRGSGVAVFPHTGGFEHWTRGYETAFARAAAIHCVSEQLSTELGRFGVDPTKARVIRPGVDTEFFTPGGPQSEGELRAVAAGDLIWLKGFDYLLQAIAGLRELDVPVRLEIIGGEPAPDGGHESDRGRLLYTAHALGVEDRVTLRGHVSQSELRDALRAADVFVHPSLSEGIPNVVLEAMACARPVIVTDAGGTTEAVTDAVEGVVVPRRDPVAIAQALAALWRDPALRTKMGRAGRARVESEFTLARQVGEFIRLYERLAAS